MCVSCKAIGTTQHITKMSFPDQMLTGTIPNAISGFSQLRYLDLSAQQNKITGSIPGNAIKTMKQLTTLRLQNNHMSGTVPSLTWSQYTGSCGIGGTNNWVCHQGGYTSALTQCTYGAKLHLVDLAGSEKQVRGGVRRR